MEEVKQSGLDRSDSLGISNGQKRIINNFGGVAVERLPQAAGASRLGIVGEAAAQVAHGFYTPIPPYRWGPEGSSIQQQAGRALRKWAKEQGVYITEKQLRKVISKNKLIELPRGTEAEVYLGAEGKYVYKISNGGKRFYTADLANHWRNFFYRMIAHNQLFPSVCYEILGFTEKEGDLGVLMRQPAIEFRNGLNEDEVHEELKRGGVFQEPEKKWSLSGVHAGLGIKLEDLHPGNIVWNDVSGDAVYIDPLITYLEDSQLKTRVIAFIESGFGSG
jgi:hypothetical protein